MTDSAMFSRRSEFAELTTLIQTSISTAISPLTNKIQILDDKVDKLSQDRVIRTDLEKMQSEIKSSMVPRDSYEFRHSALVERDAQIEGTVREVRRDLEERVKSFEDRFDKGSITFTEYLQKIDTKIDLYRTQTTETIDRRLSEQNTAQLSQKDRSWMRASQITGFIGIICGMFSLIVTIVMVILQFLPHH